MTYRVVCYLRAISGKSYSGVVRNSQRSRSAVLPIIPFEEHIWIHHVEFKSCNVDEFCEYTLVVLRLLRGIGTIGYKLRNSESSSAIKVARRSGGTSKMATVLTSFTSSHTTYYPFSETEGGVTFSRFCRHFKYFSTIFGFAFQ